MLVLSRRETEKIMIGDDIVIEVLRIGYKSVRLGITAPDGVQVNREEIYKLIKAEEAEEARSANTDG